MQSAHRTPARQRLSDDAVRANERARLDGGGLLSAKFAGTAKTRWEDSMPIRSLRTIVAKRTPLILAAQATVTEAALRMREHNVGAVMVVEGTRLAGIFT